MVFDLPINCSLHSNRYLTYYLFQPLTMNSWEGGFRSPSPAGSWSSGDNGGSGSVRYTDLTLDAQLAKDLDLTSRIDRAIHKDNPFTMAKRRATRKPTMKPNIIAEAKKPRGSIKPVVTTTAIVREDNGPRRRATAAADGPTKSWRPHNGWLDGKNNPITMDEKAPSMLEALDEQEKEPLKGGKRKRVGTAPNHSPAKKQEKATKRNKAEEDKIVFTRIPAFAVASKDYPILQGLAKQRSLPKKQKKPAITSRMSTSSDSEADLSIADLIKGSRTRKPANSKPVKTVFEAVRTSSTVQHDGDRLPSGIETLVRHILPRLPSGSKTAVDSGLVSPAGGFDVSDSNDISTITHLPSSVCRELDTSEISSKAPYTSPLQGRDPSLELIRPKPQRVTEAVQLEALAALSDDHAILRYEGTRRLRHPAQSRKEKAPKLRDGCFDSQSAWIDDAADATRARRDTCYSMPRFGGFADCGLYCHDVSGH
ncbi:hypothetical protein BCR39DRAFT_598575 [Naematelia encephala]|uniref:Uncharacterized protein n=1 Tax=Naematelia encephala TaxID=71784 RepID=A0A1Y2B4L7_9TREE|nr:hypothetical protein BCR39DRAFT_598575 [Naematelia encephala]